MEHFFKLILTNKQEVLCEVEASPKWDAKKLEKYQLKDDYKKGLKFIENKLLAVPLDEANEFCVRKNNIEIKNGENSGKSTLFARRNNK